MERMESIMGQLAKLPSQDKITSDLLAVIRPALPIRNALHVAQQAYSAVRKSASKAMSQAAALFSVEVKENVVKLFPKSDPVNVHKDAFSGQWRILRDILVTEQVGKAKAHPTPAQKKEYTKERETAEKAFNRLQNLWNHAEPVMEQASKAELTAWKRSGHPNIQQAYLDIKAAEREGQAPNEKAFAKFLAVARSLTKEQLAELRTALANPTGNKVKGRSLKDSAAKAPRLPRRQKAPKA